MPSARSMNWATLALLCLIDVQQARETLEESRTRIVTEQVRKVKRGDLTPVRYFAPGPPTYCIPGGPANYGGGQQAPAGGGYGGYYGGYYGAGNYGPLAPLVPVPEAPPAAEAPAAAADELSSSSDVASESTADGTVDASSSFDIPTTQVGTTSSYSNGSSSVAATESFVELMRRAESQATSSLASAISSTTAMFPFASSSAICGETVFVDDVRPYVEQMTPFYTGTDIQWFLFPHTGTVYLVDSSTNFLIYPFGIGTTQSTYSYSPTIVNAQYISGDRTFSSPQYAAASTTVVELACQLNERNCGYIPDFNPILSAAYLPAGYLEPTQSAQCGFPRTFDIGHRPFPSSVFVDNRTCIAGADLVFEHDNLDSPTSYFAETDYSAGVRPLRTIQRGFYQSYAHCNETRTFYSNFVFSNCPRTEPGGFTNPLIDPRALKTQRFDVPTFQLQQAAPTPAPAPAAPGSDTDSGSSNGGSVEQGSGTDPIAAPAAKPAPLPQPTVMPDSPMGGQPVPAAVPAEAPSGNSGAGGSSPASGSGSSPPASGSGSDSGAGNLPASGNGAAGSINDNTGGAVADGNAIPAANGGASGSPVNNAGTAGAAPAADSVGGSSGSFGSSGNAGISGGANVAPAAGNVGSASGGAVVPASGLSGSSGSTGGGEPVVGGPSGAQGAISGSSASSGGQGEIDANGDAVGNSNVQGSSSSPAQGGAQGGVSSGTGSDSGSGSSSGNNVNSGIDALSDNAFQGNGAQRVASDGTTPDIPNVAIPLAPSVASIASNAVSGASQALAAAGATPPPRTGSATFSNAAGAVSELRAASSRLAVAASTATGSALSSIQAAQTSVAEALASISSVVATASVSVARTTTDARGSRMTTSVLVAATALTMRSRVTSNSAGVARTVVETDVLSEATAAASGRASATSRAGVDRVGMKGTKLAGSLLAMLLGIQLY